MLLLSMKNISLYSSCRGGVKTLLWLQNKLRKTLLFITKDFNEPNGSVQIYRNEETKKNQPLQFL